MLWCLPICLFVDHCMELLNLEIYYMLNKSLHKFFFLRNQKETPSNPVTTTKAGERQWCDVGIFKNNTALVSQFYLLPKGKQSISKVAIDVFSTLSYKPLESRMRCCFFLCNFN